MNAAKIVDNRLKILTLQYENDKLTNEGMIFFVKINNEYDINIIIIQLCFQL